ncbi:hypothetical protein [Nocardioides sp. AX2bis]|uniref:hypothetical protein n=1 Tax=Nocardioides sp. AX2bis TaxID=2653157 RepID=UPI0012EFC582|nr:hypothetical protein [Nocardioides sp. AX2bis]VXA93826.1 conserved hypothetical protein [Nocardioides sp. AX2bis]
MSGRERSRRQVWRRRLLLAGVLPALAAAAFSLEVVVVLHHDAEGRGALADGAPARAAEAYAANRTLNLLEPWVAPYDEATARFRAGDPVGAVRGYATALPLAPAEQECRVRTDLALAHAAAGAPARGVRALGDCPVTDERAAEVLSALQDDLAAADEAAEADEQVPTDPPPDEPSGPGDGQDRAGRGEQAARQGELGERNDRGQERRQQAEDRADGTGIGAGRGQGRGDPGAGEAGPPAYSW